MKMKARVTWLDVSEGGRTSPPSINRYVAIGRFREDGPEWPNGAWTVVVEFDPPTTVQGNPCIGEAFFLMESAPHERLRDGKRFELYEGRKKVALVEIIGDSRV